MRKFISNDEFKFWSDLTNQNSKEYDSQSVSNFSKSPRYIKEGIIKKKGIFFFNERNLYLTPAWRLYYAKNEVEKEIDLNPTTTVRQVGYDQFEITNYYPTTNVRFKTENERDCEEWVIAIQKAIQNLYSD